MLAFAKLMSHVFQFYAFNMVISTMPTGRDAQSYVKSLRHSKNGFKHKLLLLCQGQMTLNFVSMQRSAVLSTCCETRSCDSKIIIIFVKTV